MLKKIIVTCLIIGFGVASQANATITTFNFANIEPIKYGNEFSDILAGFKANEDAEEREFNLEAIRLENALKHIELQHALEQYKYETKVKKSGSKNLRQRQNNENLYLTKAVKPKTVRVRGYYKKMALMLNHITVVVLREENK